MYFLSEQFWLIVMSTELLSIHFFIPSTCPTHDVTNFIDFDWFWQSFWPFFIWSYSSLNRYNFGTKRDIKKRWTAMFLIFAALSNSEIKKHFSRTFILATSVLSNSIYSWQESEIWLNDQVLLVEGSLTYCGHFLILMLIIIKGEQNPSFSEEFMSDCNRVVKIQLYTAFQKVW